MNADVISTLNIADGLTRALIRARLAVPRAPKVRGDVAIAMELMRAGGLEAHDFGTFGQVPSTGIPYSEGAGAPGVKIKRKPAAVLVPLIEMPVGFSVLLTKRTSDLKQHAGQIAFPGGRMEAGDTDAAACALRETQEETGLEPEAVEILGTLDPYVTITGYEVTPVVGAIKPPFMLKPDPIEVAETFEVPLSFLMDPVNHHRVEREYKGLTRAYYAMPFGQKYIWGATAGMILNFYEVLSAEQHAAVKI